MSAGTREALMKTSSRDSRMRGPVRYLAASELDDIAGDETWLLTKSCKKKSRKKSRPCVCRTVKSTGWVGKGLYLYLFDRKATHLEDSE